VLESPTTGYAADLVSWTTDYMQVLSRFQKHLDSLAAIRKELEIGLQNDEAN
jgi:hypothetical protein